MSFALKELDSVYVAGEWVKPKSDPDPVFNPATEEVIGLAPVGGRVEMEAAIAAAREAFDKGVWPRMSPQERGAKLREMHAELAKLENEIVELMVLEVGALRSLAKAGQFDKPMRDTLHTLELGSRYRDTPLPPGNTPNPLGQRTFSGGVIRREPIGVVGAITPYNFPFLLNLVKVFPALMTGNTVVLKPSPFTPFSALILAQVAEKVGLPRGVFSVVTGGKEAGELLTTDPRVDLITFTGSDATGVAIAKQGAATLKRIHLELGGKSAHIVRGDANLAEAVTNGMRFTTHCGQGCVLPSRHLVHNSVRARYVELLTEKVKALKLGDPNDPSTTLGPLIRESQRGRAEHFVAEGLKSGAKLMTGGQRPSHLPKGYFFEPTVFDNVDNASPLAQEEVFGPVVAVMGFDTDQEAIDLANDSRFGLAGYVHSADLAAAYEMACAIRAGGVHINGGGGPDGNSMPPFGGYKYSGMGRENGEEGLNAFTELKTLTFRQSTPSA